MAEEKHTYARGGPVGIGPVHLPSTPDAPFLCHEVHVQSPGNEIRFERQLKEQPDQTTGVHTDGGRRSRIVHAPKYGGILSGSGG